MWIKLRVIAVLCVGILLMSCDNGPTVTDARAVFEKMWQKEISSGQVKVTRFDKVDGVAGELLGVPVYSMQYAAEITWPKGNDIGCGQGPLANPMYPCKTRAIGQKEEFNGTIGFQKTENGWQGEIQSNTKVN
jgi:hypothetical protein